MEEYTLGLLEELFKLDTKNEYILFLNSWKEPSFDFSIFSKYENVKIKRLKIPNKILNFCFWYLDWPKIDKLCGGAGVVFSPNIIFSAVSRRVKLVLTVHDLSFERHSEYFSRKRRWWHMFINTRRLAKRADRIIAVSDSTKNDLIKLYGMKKDKIRTIHSAVSGRFEVLGRNDAKLVKTKEKYGLPYNSILFLGTIEPRKNIVGVVRAFNAFQEYAAENGRADLAKYELVIAGESGWQADEIFAEMRNSSYKEKIKLINSVPDEEKPYLYNLASLFVYPSFFEGFGFPPLEAMKCGVPVIASNNSSLPEVAGGAAVMIDPDRPDEIMQAMKEILTNKELRETLIAKGIEQAKKFSWRKAAEDTLKIIQE